MRLNLDVWYEIVNYFEYPEDEDILRSLAVTSRCLSDLALDVVWRNGEHVASIESVINYFAPSLDKPFFFHSGDGDTNDDSSSSSEYNFGVWVLNGPLPPAGCQRAIEYLARIKNLEVCYRRTLAGAESSAMWPILASICPHRPILPNLQRLEVLFFLYSRKEYLLPLLSPSLKILLFSCAHPPKPKVISTLLNIVKTRGCNLEDFTYLGPLIHEVLEAIMSFKTLQNVSLSLDEIHQPTVPITIAQFLASLRSLRSLTCYVGVFAPSTGDEDQLCHTSLQKIKIRSDQKALSDLFRVCRFPSVTDVEIMFDEVLSMGGIESSCPNARKLLLSFTSTADLPLGFMHLASLRSLPIQSFAALVQKHTLTPSDLSIFVESWPNLRIFKIISKTGFDPLQSLGVFVKHQRLECLDLRLPPQGLFGLIPKMRNLMETDAVARGSSRSVLRSLTLHRNVRWIEEPPASEEDKRTLVEYLLRLFPSLQDLKLEPVGSFSDIRLGELQEILARMEQR